MTKVTTYKAEDIFEEIADDPENVLMNIPPEVIEQMNWKPGDKLSVSVKDGQITITKVN